MLIRYLCNKIEKIYAFDYKERIICEKNLFENIIINFGKCGIWRCCTNYRILLFDR